MGAATTDLAFFCINLDRSRERWSRIEAAFGGLGWPLNRVAALDAQTQPDAVLARRGLTLTYPPSGAGWNHLRARPHALVEEACFVSHLEALHRFLDSGHAFGLILEDDAEPVADLAALLPRIAAAGDFDIVKLEGVARSGGRPAFLAANLGTHRLVRSLRPSSGAAAYLVTRDAARRLIDRAGAITIPFDDYLWGPGFNGLDILHVSPFAVRQSGHDTTMGAGRAPVAKGKKRDLYNYVSLRVARGTQRVLLWKYALSAALRHPGAPLIAPWRTEQRNLAPALKTPATEVADHG